MDERRLLLAALLSLGLIILWQVAFPSSRAVRPAAEEIARAEESATPLAKNRDAEAPQAAAAESQQQAEGGDAVGQARVSSEDTPTLPDEVAELEQRLVVEGLTFRAELSNRGAQLVSFVLRDHRSRSGEPLDLVRARTGEVYPFGLVTAGLEPLALDDELFVAERNEDGREVHFRFRRGGVECEKRFRFSDEGVIDVEIRATGSGTDDYGVFLGPGVRNPSLEEAEARYQLRTAVYRTGGKLEKVAASKAEGELLSGSGLEWVGLQDTYFLTAVVPGTPLEQVSIVPVIAAEEGDWRHFQPLPPKESRDSAVGKQTRELVLVLQPRDGEFQAATYWGAKQYDALEALPWGLEKTVDWGFFGVLSRPLLWALQQIHDRLVPNYGWAIVVMTILLKIVLLPLTHKSQVSMQKMQEVNPKVQAIRAKYKGKMRDKQGRFNADSQRKMQEEMQAIYKQEGVNPAGGCLPMLLQMPVFFAFFRLLPTAVELRLAPWMLWVQDLSAPDPLYVLPIVMGVTQFLQQRLTPAAGDPMQRRMMQLVPVVFVVFSFGFPSGLVLYWLVNNLMTMAQMAVYNRIKERRRLAAG